MSDSSQSNSGSNQGQPPNRQKEKMKPTWFRMLFGVALLGVVLGAFGALSNGGKQLVIKEQLEKLREDRITQAYYEYTSRAFQQTTSLDEFRKFISLYDVLSNNKSFQYDTRTEKDGVVQITGILISKDLHEMKAEYLLVKEDNAWKIQSIRLMEQLRGDDLDSATQKLVDKVHDQLKALRRDEIVNAYYDFLAKDFQKDTPLQVFREYVESNPILTSFKNVDFKGRRIEGDMGFVDLLLSSDAGDFMVEYKLKRENDDWKVWSLHLTLPPEEAVKKLATDPDALVGPVRDLLNSLLLDKIEQAYRHTAKEFQEATTLSAFETFVHTYPALSRRELTDIKTGMIENGAGKLRVNLHDEEGMTSLEFKLGFDEGQWKIWGVKILESPERDGNDLTPEEAKKQDKQSLAEQLIKVIQEKLSHLVHQDIAYAYHKYFSHDFQDTRSLTQFENYVSDNPAMEQARDSSFDRMVQRGKLITLKGTIRALNNKIYPVHYEFVKEDGVWKINDIEILPVKREVAEAEPKKEKVDPSDIPIEESEDIDVANTDIKKIIVGDEVDVDGMIKTPRVVIDSNTNLLFINIKIEDGIKDSLVTVFLNHIDSGTTAPPLSTKLKKSGNTIVSFSYAAPTEGWPEGNYLIKVTTNTGDEHIQGFQMRKGEKKFY